MLYVNKQRTDSKAKYSIIPEHSFLYNPQIVIVAKVPIILSYSHYTQ